jgi:hypothetical protein
VSARHQIKRLDRIFNSRKPVRQKKQVFFVRCGSTGSAISPGAKPGRNLVLTCSPTPSFPLPGDVPGFFISHHIAVLIVHGISAVAVRALAVSPVSAIAPVRIGFAGAPGVIERANVAAMVIASRNATVNRLSRMPINRCGTGVSLISYQDVSTARLHPVHREP